ncbi:PLC-like phosphodiesterase [Cordyceps militaris CM01]|uniref:Phosphoinositide phospholipase C n=1 Tax=Cordyceps militaris (strain CM01) TaxID=983644 RepID=G3JP35_CORMM|nr:PLC-like phosphodiesterase [Cordyceps militaris CM01]EGX89645.1 PLC-like phosphodiesterase [Cordyceps militaris CM01]
MSSPTAQLRRRPSPAIVQTNVQPQHSNSAPISAISASSVASSRQASPAMSPDTAVLTTNSSLQASPDAPLPRPDDDVCPPNFQLPESIVSHKTSVNSLAQGWTGNGSQLTEMASNGPASPVPTPAKTNLIRRLSSRASRSINSRRRQSSAAPSGRDSSVGPCFLRSRSDSNTGAPPEYAPAHTDSESEFDDRDEFGSLLQNNFMLDGSVRDVPKPPTRSATSPVGGSSTTMAGPVIPLQLQQGIWLRKISKKSRSKRIRLQYDPDSNKLVWDKARPQKSLHVDEIREIRTGSDIQQYGRDFKIPESERSTWFSILYSVPERSKSKFMHLIADDTEACNIWTTFLHAMLRHRQEVMTSLMSFNDKAIAQYWQTEMAKQPDFGGVTEELDLAGVRRVCQNLHIYSSHIIVQANFRIADARGRERLNFGEFLEFVRLMKQRKDIRHIMHLNSANPDLGMTMLEFFTFLRDVQGEDVDSNRATWEKSFARLARKYRSEGAQEGVPEGPEELMSEDAFVAFLSSRHNTPVADEPQDYTLDRPMNEYFISSSHNTYLLGRQVAGRSSIEGYIAALVRGCRCVEVDCWDGSDGQPQVVHGRTLTTSISFKEVMTTINKYAFVKSNFPLWISLEVHCNAMQQAIMAETIKEAFGSRLVTEPLDPSSTKLPSPSELMGRILIKVKEPRMRDDSNMNSTSIIAQATRGRGNSVGSSSQVAHVSQSPAPYISHSLPQSPLLSGYPGRVASNSRHRVQTINEEIPPIRDMSSHSDTESGSDTGSASQSANKTIPVLGKLGVYCAGVKFPGFDAPAAKKFNHIFSFMESSFSKNSRSKEDKMSLNIHNMRYLMRVYPDGTRLASSNFDPLLYWRRGVQMAALNWQTFDSGMQLNRAMFDGGRDSSGYVLKPPELRDIQVLPYNSDIARGKKERSIVSFSIHMLSAQQLMRPANLAASKSMDFYVEVEVLHANDKRDKKEEPFDRDRETDTSLKFQTEVIRENGFSPMFMSSQFKFKVVTKHPELVFVRWSVKLSNNGESYSTKDRPPIASYTAKLCNLNNGYRTLPLLNHAGDQYLFSTLFCRVQKYNTEKTLIDAPRAPPDGSKLNRFGGKVFGRSNTSPRGTIEKTSMEKTSFESFS